MRVHDHLTVSQLAMQGALSIHAGFTASVIAKMLGVGVSTVRSAKTVANHRPDLVPRVLAGELSVRRAAKDVVSGDPDVAIAEHVYFIQSESGHIKIGFSTHPELRLAEFQIGCPYRLRLLFAVPMHRAGRASEAGLHARFEASRFRGEWFNPTPDVLAFVETMLKARAADEDLGFTNRPTEVSP